MEPKTINTAGNKTVTDLPAAPAPPAPAARGAWLKEQFTKLPEWAKAIGILALLAFFLYTRATKQDAPPVVVNVPAPAAVGTVQGATPVADVGLVEGLLPRGELRKRIALRFARNGAVERAVRDGIPGPDGKVRKLTREQAEAAVAGVSDDLIVGAAAEVGAPFGEGGRLEAFLSWLWEHREQIIKLILSLLALFGEPTAIEIQELPDGTGLVTAWYDWGSVVRVL
ncbi:hypothetical protein [Gemmata sp.]|uniref:hypothetical protein n=1 Tax=Gemmata sp. TaxID=1914242 RepID=UPI003F6FBF71